MGSALEDELIRHNIGLQRYNQHVLQRIQRHLERVQSDIELQTLQGLSDIGDPGNVWTTKGQKRLRALKEAIENLQVQAHKALRADFEDDIDLLATYEGQYAVDVYRKMLRLNTELHYITPRQLRSIVMSRPFQGLVLRDWAKKMEKGQTERIWKHIQIGLTEKEGLGEIVKRLRGTGALQYRDGQFAKDKRSAEALVRTATNHVHNRAQTALGEANPETFPRYRWVSILDARTTWICRSRAGNVYPTGKGPLPPAHWNCRSTVVYLSAFSNQEPEPRFETWLRRQHVDAQEEILGPKRYKFWKQGKLPLKRFTDPGGRPWTLEELKARDKAAWQRAFSDD